MTVKTVMHDRTKSDKDKYSPLNNDPDVPHDADIFGEVDGIEMTEHAPDSYQHAGLARGFVDESSEDDFSDGQNDSLILDADRFETDEMDIFHQGEVLRRRKRKATRLAWIIAITGISLCTLFLSLHGVVLASMFVNHKKAPEHNTTPEECCAIYNYTTQTVVNTDDPRGYVHLHTWYFPGFSTNEFQNPIYDIRRNNYTVLVSHDLGTNMAHYEYADGSASAVAKYVRPLIKAGFNVLMWDKRNHGLSQHMPPIALGLYEQSDVKAMINWLVETHPLACTDGQVAILGEGVGAAEAMYAAATDDRIAAVVSDSSYLTGALSMKEWVYSHWYLIYVPLTWISHWQWCLELVAGWSFSDMDVAAVMGASHTPVLIAHGTRDEWHQFADGKLLYEYVLGNRTEQGAPTEWFPYAQAHTQGYLEPNYFERVIEFLDVHFKISVSPPVAINEAVTKKRTKPQNAADSKGEKENPDSKNRPPHQPEVEDSTEQQPPTPTTQASPKETLDSKNRPPPPPAVEDRTEQHPSTPTTQASTTVTLDSKNRPPPPPAVEDSTEQQPSTPTTQASTTEPVKPDTEAHAQSGADAESKDKPAPKPEPEDR